jgi:hypothetical protein
MLYRIEHGTLMTFFVQCSINQEDTAGRSRLSNKPDRSPPSAVSAFLLYFAQEYPIFDSMTKID